MTSIKIVCVRNGKGYGMQYVVNLYSMVSRHCRWPFHFVCVTDDPEEYAAVMGDVGMVLPLELEHSQWWAKVEVFRIHGPCLYFDLDTVLVNSITQSARGLTEVEGEMLEHVWMLKPFNQKRREEGSWASGVMAWTGDWSWIYDWYKQDPESHRRRADDWDQLYFTNVLQESGYEIRDVGNLVPGLYSYKWNVRGNGGPPLDATAVLFHGRPRPHEVREEPWMQRNWQ